MKAACGEKKFAANRAVEFVRALYNWCGKSADGKVNFLVDRAGNPAADITTFAENERERYLTPTELVRFNEALKKETHADLKDFLILADEHRRAEIGYFFDALARHPIRDADVARAVSERRRKSYNVQLLPAGAGSAAAP